MLENKCLSIDTAIRSDFDPSGVDSLSQQPNAEGGFLRFINYYIHHGCNLSCPYCKVKEQQVKPMDGRSRAEVLTRLRRLSSDRTVLGITGGEFTLVPDLLLDVVLDAVEAGFYVSLNTNGYGLTTNLIEKLAEINKVGDSETETEGVITQIAISVDCGLSEKADLDGALKLLNFARGKCIVPVINTVFTSQTDIPAFKKFVDYINSKGIFVNPMACSPAVENGVFSNASSDDRPTARQIRELIPWLAWKKIRYGHIATTFGYLWTLFQSSFSQDSPVWHCSPVFRSKTNPKGRGFLTLDSDGHIGPCQEFPRIINILDIPPEELSLQLFDQQFGETIGKCPGCAYGCYVNENNINGVMRAVEAAMTTLPMAATWVGAGDTLYKYRINSKYHPFKDLSQIFPRRK